MFIDVQELELHAIDFDVEFRPAIIDLGPEIRQMGALSSKGHAELLEEHRGRGHKIQDIRLVGRLTARIEVSCARCLEPVVCPVDRNFDLLYRPQGSDAGREELSVTDAEADIGYYSGNGLLLEEVLREQVLLSEPMKAVCREQCQGLCPQCGQNLNQGACGCAPSADPRWQALEGLKKRLEE